MSTQMRLQHVILAAAIAFLWQAPGCSPAFAGGNPTVVFEPDEEDAHAVDMKRAIVNIETVTLTKVDGAKSDPTPGDCSTDGGCTSGGMVTAVSIVDGNGCTNCAIEYVIDPDAGGTDRDGNNYRVHFRGRDASGRKITFNGGLSVRSEDIEF